MLTWKDSVKKKLTVEFEKKRLLKWAWCNHTSLLKKQFFSQLVVEEGVVDFQNQDLVCCHWTRERENQIVGDVDSFQKLRAALADSQQGSRDFNGLKEWS